MSSLATLREHARRPGAARGLLVAGAVLAPLLVSVATGTPMPAIDPLAVASRALGALATCKLLRVLGVPPRSAWWAAALYAAVGLRDRPCAGAALAVLLLAVAVARQHRRLALACAAGGTALALGTGDAEAGELALAAVAPWAAWRMTAVPRGWDGPAALPLLGGALTGAVATLPFWPNAPGATAGDAATWPVPNFVVVAALAAAVLSATAVVVRPTRGHGALRSVLALWLVLYGGRALGLSWASFTVDIATSMSDSAFLASATPGLVLGVLVGTALSTADRCWMRAATGALALSVMASVVLRGNIMPSAHDIEFDAAVREKPLALAPGQSVSGVIQGPGVPAGSVHRFGIEIGTYLGAADGRLALILCAPAQCRSGEADIASAADNAVLRGVLDAPLATPAGAALHWKATHVGGRSPIAIWLRHTSRAGLLDGPDGPIASAAAAHVVLEYATEDRAPATLAR